MLNRYGHFVVVIPHIMQDNCLCSTYAVCVISNVEIFKAHGQVCMVTCNTVPFKGLEHPEILVFTRVLEPTVLR